MPDFQKFMMRHGEHSVQFIVEQIEKIEGVKYGESALLEDRWTALKADKLEIEASARALEGVKVQAHVGTRTTLDELNAEQELLDAKTDLAKSEHDRCAAVLQIKASIGDLTADALKLPLTPYDPERHYNDRHAQWIGYGGADEDMYAKKNDADTTQD